MHRHTIKPHQVKDVLLFSLECQYTFGMSHHHHREHTTQGQQTKQWKAGYSSSAEYSKEWATVGSSSQRG